LQAIYNQQKLDSLVSAYESIRPLAEAEKQVWPRLLELAAFRFYLSRLKTKYMEGYQQEVKAGEAIKSPEAMKLILLASMQM
jgi:homoserine kinase type II